MAGASLILLTLLAFQLKHLICDFVIQTRYQVDNKGWYGHRGGLVHAGWHALFSAPVLLIIARAPGLIALTVAIEFIIHYHVDWLKARSERMRGWSQSDPIYWMAFGTDQFIHQVTYILMVLFVLRAG